MQSIWGNSCAVQWLASLLGCGKSLHAKCYGKTAIHLSVSLLKVANWNWSSYWVRSSSSLVLPSVCAICSGVTPSSFARLTAIRPPGWQSSSSASRYRPHRTARWRGDSLRRCSGDKGRDKITEKKYNSAVVGSRSQWQNVRKIGGNWQVESLVLITTSPW